MPPTVVFFAVKEAGIPAFSVQNGSPTRQGRENARYILRKMLAPHRKGVLKTEIIFARARCGYTLYSGSSSPKKALKMELLPQFFALLNGMPL